MDYNIIMKNNYQPHYTNEERKKEAMFMSTAVLLKETKDKYLQEMDKYIMHLQAQPLDVAKQEAIRALKRTGVMTSNGKQKKKIVSWE